MPDVKPPGRPKSAASGAGAGGAPSIAVNSWVSSGHSSTSSTGKVLNAATRLDPKELTLQILIVVVPLTVIAILAQITLVQSIEETNQATRLGNLIRDVTQLEHIFSALQGEQSAQCALLTAKRKKGDVDTADMLLQDARSKTDNEISTTLKNWHMLNADHFKTYLNGLKQEINMYRIAGGDDKTTCQMVVKKQYGPMMDEFGYRILQLIGDIDQGQRCQMVGTFVAWDAAQSHFEQWLSAGTEYFNSYEISTAEHAKFFQDYGAIDGLLSYGIDAFECKKCKENIDDWKAHYKAAHEEAYAHWQLLDTAMIYKNASSDILSEEDGRLIYSGDRFRKIVEEMHKHLEDITSDVVHTLMEQLKENVAERDESFWYEVIFTIAICLICPVLVAVYAVYAAKQRRKIIEVATKMREQSHLLEAEERKTTHLLNQMLPRAVTEAIRNGNMVEPEAYDSVTVLVSDMVGFTPLCSKSTPLQVVAVLNMLFVEIDQILEIHDCYKVETVGDMVIVASGVPMRNNDLHSKEIGLIALDLLMNLKNVQLSHFPGEHPMMRVGIHTGACTAGVVGMKSPKYALFGECAEVAMAMESHSKPMRIQLSSSAYEHMHSKHPGEFTFKERGEIEIKDRGLMTTFWLLGASDHPYSIDLDAAKRTYERMLYPRRD